MSKNIWFISDTHFDHNNILKFKDKDDNLIRPGFDNVKHMNEFMVEQWNSAVKPGDKIYHCGDFGFGTKSVKYINRLNGQKRLILGNHDDVKKDKLYDYFQKIHVWRVFREFDFVATHIPINEKSLSKIKFNIHGHTHQNDVRYENGQINLRYFNVSVEKNNYRPFHVDEILAVLNKRKI